MSEVNLTISQDLIKPILEAKIKEGLLQALGNQTEIINQVINNFMNMRVDYKGEVSRYSSDNNQDYISFYIKKSMQDALKEAADEWLKIHKEKIKEQFFKTLSSKKGMAGMVEAFVAGMTENFKTNDIKVEMKYQYKRD